MIIVIRSNGIKSTVAVAVVVVVVIQRVQGSPDESSGLTASVRPVVRSLFGFIYGFEELGDSLLDGFAQTRTAHQSRILSRRSGYCDSYCYRLFYCIYLNCLILFSKFEFRGRSPLVGVARSLLDRLWHDR